MIADIADPINGFASGPGRDQHRPAAQTALKDPVGNAQRVGQSAGTAQPAGQLAFFGRQYQGAVGGQPSQNALSGGMAPHIRVHSGAQAQRRFPRQAQQRQRQSIVRDSIRQFSHSGGAAGSHQHLLGPAGPVHMPGTTLLASRVKSIDDHRMLTEILQHQRSHETAGVRSHDDANLRSQPNQFSHHPGSLISRDAATHTVEDFHGCPFASSNKTLAQAQRTTNSGRLSWSQPSDENQRRSTQCA